MRRPPRRFEIRDLHDNRERFGDEDAADHEEQQHLAAENRSAREQRAERERAGIAHEELRRMPIEEQKTGARADAGGRTDRRGRHLHGCGNQGEHGQRRNHRPGRETVETVGQD